MKHDEGGMVDVEFIVQYFGAQYSAKFPQLVNNFGNIKMLEMASDAGLDSEEPGARSVGYLSQVSAHSARVPAELSERAGACSQRRVCGRCGEGS